MSEFFLHYLPFTYLTVGVVLTIYTIIIYFFTGTTLFREAGEAQAPFRHKVSYVLVMAFMLPVFYIAFLREIFSLRKDDTDA